MSKFTMNNLPRWLTGNGSMWGLFKGSPRKRSAPDSAVTKNGDFLLTDTTAIQVSSVLAAVRVISQAMGQVEKRVSEKKFDETKRRFSYDPVYNSQSDLWVLLCEKPNNYQTAFEFYEGMTIQAALTGNAFALIVRTSRRVLELHPIPSNSVKVVMDENRRVTYEVTVTGDKVRIYQRDQILHLRGPSVNGMVGENILEAAAEAIGISKYAEAAHSEALRRRGRMDGLLSSKTNVSEEKAGNIKRSLADTFGPGSPGGIALLDGDIQFSQVQSTAKDMELIEHRKFAIDDTGRAFGVYSQLLNQHAANSAYASVEQVFIAHETNTINPWFVRWEEAIKRDVIGYSGDYKKLYFRFRRNELTRGTLKDIGEFLNKVVTLGVLTPNEAREYIGYNPSDIEGADVPTTQLNMRSGYVDPAQEVSQNGNSNMPSNSSGVNSRDGALAPLQDTRNP